MTKEFSFTLRACNWVLKYSIYTLIALIPVFFLSLTTDVLDFNKQTLLVFLSFLALFAWSIKVLVSGKMEIYMSKIHIIVGSFFLVSLLATIFSVNNYGSFWGWPQSSSGSLLTLIALVIVYFIISNSFSKKEVYTSIIILSVSALIAQIIGALQLFGLFIIPLGFTKSIAFNTLGSIGSLAFFTAILLPIFIILLIISKRWLRIFFAIGIVLSAIILIAINYAIAWWAVAIGAVVVMIFGILKKNLFDGRWMALPMFFLAISLFFIILTPQVSWISTGTNEISLSHRATLQMSLQTLKERPIFGSGPGTFAYTFLKFKNESFSSSLIWSTVFNNGSSSILGSIATTGILGFIALLALIAFPIYHGIRFLTLDKESTKNNWALILGLLTSLFVFALTYLLYNINVTLGFLFFFVLACLVAMISGQKKTYELKPSSLLTLTVTFAFTLVFIFGFGILILDGQRYIAEAKYSKGVGLLREGQIEAGTINLQRAASLNPSSDLYFRQLSQVYLSTLQRELGSLEGESSDEQKQRFQILIANSVNAAKRSTDLNPSKSVNWANRGFIYQSLSGLMDGAEEWALTSYDRAIELDPNNPYLFFQEGNVKYILALTGSPEEKNQLLNEAREKLERSVTLNPNYSNAFFSLGLVHDILGQKNEAINNFMRVQQLNPMDENIAEIVKNLKAGKSALGIAEPPIEVPPDESVEEGTVVSSEEEDEEGVEK